MGNFHCVTSNCARVVYREYLPPVVRWRYEGEDWNEVDGDDYTIDDKQTGQCEGAFYRMVYQEWRPNLKDSSGPLIKFGGDQLYLNALFTGKIVDWYITDNKGNLLDPEILKLKVNGNARTRGFKLYIVHDSGKQTTKTFDGIYQLIEPIYFVGINNKKDCFECEFKVFKQDRIVYSETRDVCPEVEQLPCRLSDVSQEIKIEKLPYLERIEVVDYAYDVRLGALNDAGGDYGFFLAKKEINHECLNIYKNNIASTIPTTFGNIANTPENGYNQVTQICSAPNCPPPEYEVICDCDDDECPDGTCPIICGANSTASLAADSSPRGSHICCYDSNGISVKQIPVSNLFPGGAS